MYTSIFEREITVNILKLELFRFLSVIKYVGMYISRYTALNVHIEKKL